MSHSIMHSTQFLVLIVIIFQVQCQLQQVAQPADGSGSGSDSFLVQLNELLRKCSSLSTLEQCDMCSLCQNGAMCHQKARSSSALTTRKPLVQITNPFKGSLDSLSLLRSLIDFTCYCVPGYTGTYCQIEVNECLSSPCSNNATCVDHVNAYECRCPAGFAGDSCQININECESAPCRADAGVCIDLVDGFFCQCKPGFTGPSCATNINECASLPCANNATCIDLVNG